jgi:hypothetical protein
MENIQNMEYKKSNFRAVQCLYEDFYDYEIFREEIYKVVKINNIYCFIGRSYFQNNGFDKSYMIGTQNSIKIESFKELDEFLEKYHKTLLDLLDNSMDYYHYSQDNFTSKHGIQILLSVLGENIKKLLLN